MIAVEFVCVQCAMKQFVELLESGQDPRLVQGGPTPLEGDIAEHMRTHHPDEASCARERIELNARANAAWAKIRARSRAMAANAENN